MSLSSKSTSLPVVSGNATADRISDLPNSIICHILSFLPTKKSIATSILSKRWKLLWTSVVNLDFRCPEYYTDSTIKEDRFVKFVDDVLLHHEHGYLDRFSLTWDRNCNPDHFSRWIDVAVTRNVLELIARSDYTRFSIHDQTHLFTSQRLQSLDIRGEICLPETVVSLPRLERVSLDLVRFPSEEAFRKLVVGCPVLKYLYVRLTRPRPMDLDCDVGFKSIISSTSLKHLHLDDFYSAGGVELDAPSLEYLKLEKIRSIVVQQRLNLLREATIELVPFRYDELNFNSFVEVLHAISCAKTLNLSGAAIMALSRASINMETEFNRLTRLEVQTGWEYWSSIQDFLELSDNLQALIINKGEYEYRPEDNVGNPNWREVNVVPRCLSNSLKTVKICHYDTCPDKLAMVKYILKHGAVAEIMCIFLNGYLYSKRKNELIRVISSFPRKSTACQLRFNNTRLN